MTWYRTGTVAVTNGSANVTLTGGDALANIFPDDGFIGPDGKTYGIATIGGAGSFTLQTNYGGATASGQAYGIIPVADYVQLRDQIEAVNTLITAYQTIALNAGVGLFAPGSAAAPGVRGVGHTGTGLVWNGDNTLSVSVAGTIVATFTTGGNRFPDGTVGAPGMSFVSDTNTGIYRPAADTLGIVTGGVERVRVASDGRLRAGSSLGTSQNALFYLNGGDGSPYPLGISGLTKGIRFQFSTTTASIVGVDPTLGASFQPLALSGSTMSYGSQTGGGHNFTINGVDRAIIDNNGFQAFQGSAGAPGYSFIGDTDTGIYRGSPDTFTISTGGTARLSILSSGHVLPAADNAYQFGSGSFRWSIIYAATGTINTSDEDEKTWRGALTKAELKAGTRIIGEIGLYQWNDAIAEKGKDARIHVGVRAQQVWRIMAEEGLVDPITDNKPGKTPYAFLCWDEWEDQTEPVMAERTIPAKYEGRGKNRVEVEPERVEQYDTGKTRVTMEAGNRYGVRPDQLIMFLIAAQEARIAAIEERLNND